MATNEDALVGGQIKNFRANSIPVLSQTDLAERMTDRGHPMTQQTILKIEKGARALKLTEAAVFAEVFDVPISSLVVPSEETMQIQRSKRINADIGRNAVGLARSAIAIEHDIIILRGLLGELSHESLERVPDAVKATAARTVDEVIHRAMDIFRRPDDLTEKDVESNDG